MDLILIFTFINNYHSRFSRIKELVKSSRHYMRSSLWVVQMYEHMTNLCQVQHQVKLGEERKRILVDWRELTFRLLGCWP